MTNRGRSGALAKLREMQALRRRGWTLKRIANFYGVSRQQVHQWLKTASRPEKVSDTTRAPESRCLNCGEPMKTLGVVMSKNQDPANPAPGAVIICIQCGAVMVLDENLSLCGMTTAEMDQLVADRDWRELALRLVDPNDITFIKRD